VCITYTAASAFSSSSSVIESRYEHHLGAGASDGIKYVKISELSFAANINPEPGTTHTWCSSESDGNGGAWISG